jgi:hypothetical protein
MIHPSSKVTLLHCKHVINAYISHFEEKFVRIISEEATFTVHETLFFAFVKDRSEVEDIEGEEYFGYVYCMDKTSVARSLI